MSNLNRIPPGKVCYRCGNNATLRERNSKGIETGKLICKSCYTFKWRYGSYKNPYKHGNSKLKLKYNIGDICPRCKEDGTTEGSATDDNRLRPQNAHTEKDKDGNGTGRAICSTHRHKDYYCNIVKHDPNSHMNIQKALRNCRTGNQDPKHESTKGDIDVDIICELYDYENLNKIYDNYTTEIDCRDKKTGELYQIEGRSLGILNTHITSNGEERHSEGWGFAPLEREWHKKYKSMILICKSKDGKMIERLYRIPPWEINGIRKSVTIVGCPTDCVGDSIIPWYEKYRVKDSEKLRKANEILDKKLEIYGNKINKMRTTNYDNA